MTIVGLGSTGQEVARRAHAFDMRVIGVRRRVDQRNRRSLIALRAR